MSYTGHVSGSYRIDPPLKWSEIRESRFLEQNQKASKDQTDVVLLVDSEERETDDGVTQILSSNTVVPCRPAFDCRALDEHTEMLVVAMREIGRTVTGEMLVQPHDYGDGGIWRVVVDENGVRKDMAQLTWPDGTSVEIP